MILDYLNQSLIVRISDMILIVQLIHGISSLSIRLEMPKFEEKTNTSGPSICFFPFSGSMWGNLAEGP
mgnify:CR=1 FL=1